MYLVDTSAWVEILRGTQKGKKCAALIAKQNCYTSGIVIAELSKWCWGNSLDVSEKISQVDGLCNDIIGSNRVCELRAGFLCHETNKAVRKGERNIGLIDCLIAALAEENNLTVLTKDTHFTKFAEIKKELL